tara:strand:- start:36 stop:383 length:348 start_codon:yes stop_codon:yes gene_type:complete
MKNVVLIIDEFKPFTGEHIRLIKKARNLGDVVACIPKKDTDTIEILRELSGVHTIESGESLENLYHKYKDEGIVYCVNPSATDKEFCKKKYIQIEEIDTAPTVNPLEKLINSQNG